MTDIKKRKFYIDSFCIDIYIFNWIDIHEQAY